MLDNSTIRTDPEKASMFFTRQNKMLKGKFTLFSFQYEKTENVMGMECFISGHIRKAQIVCLSVILQHGQNAGRSTVCGSHTS